jgi:hypothetical protein
MQPTFDHAALQTVTELSRARLEALVEGSPESVEPQVRALHEALGESLVAHYQIGEQVEPALCRRHAIRDLRVLEGITPHGVAQRRGAEI